MWELDLKEIDIHIPKDVRNSSNLSNTAALTTDCCVLMLYTWCLSILPEL